MRVAIWPPGLLATSPYLTLPATPPPEMGGLAGRVLWVFLEKKRQNATLPAIYGKGFVKPVGRCKSTRRKSARIPRRRRRRSICPISAGTWPGFAPSAAYPLSPRRREIVPLPPRNRAGTDVNVNAQPSIRDRPLGTNVASKKVSEGCHHSHCRRSTMGWSSWRASGSSFRVLTSTGTPARQNLGSHGWLLTPW